MAGWLGDGLVLFLASLNSLVALFARLQVAEKEWMSWVFGKTNNDTIAVIDQSEC